MSFLDSLAVGLQALSVNKMRSMLTVLGIIIGVAAVVCMVSVGSGAREEVSEKIRTLGANLLLIRPGAQLSGGGPTGNGHAADTHRRRCAGASARTHQRAGSCPIVVATNASCCRQQQLGDACRRN